MGHLRPLFRFYFDFTQFILRHLHWPDIFNGNAEKRVNYGNSTERHNKEL